MNKDRDIIIAPIVTEKSNKITQDEHKYVFKVARGANKIEIKKAIENIFAVEVSKVNVINTKPKRKKVGRYVGMTNKYKKAIITLKQGNKIEL